MASKINRETRFVTEAAVTAGLYAALTLVSSLFGLSSGAVQVRLSEALCILPIFTPAAIPGLAAGCLIGNLITGCTVFDVIFGTLATLIGAVGTRLLRNHSILACLPPITANALIIPPVLINAYHIPKASWLVFLTVAAGEILSCGVLGTILGKALKKNREFKNRI